jgi:hypothetical protein
MQWLNFSLQFAWIKNVLKNVLDNIKRILTNVTKLKHTLVSNVKNKVCLVISRILFALCKPFAAIDAWLWRTAKKISDKQS